jgi:hypothetical protein
MTGVTAARPYLSLWNTRRPDSPSMLGLIAAVGSLASETLREREPLAA